MKKVIDFILENYEYLAPLVYELVVRLLPTKKNLSIVDLIYKILNFVIPNIRKQHLSIILVFISFTLSAQNNSNIRQIRFFDVASSNDTIPTSSGSHAGRMWYDFNSNQWRGTQDTVNVSFINIGDTTGGAGISGLIPNTLPYATTPTTIASTGITYNSTNKGLTFANGSTVSLFTKFTSIYFGNSAGNNAATGSSNIAIGQIAGNALTTGQENVLLGTRAGGSITSGSDNVIIGGNFAGRFITTGTHNTILGYSAGGALTTQSNSIFIGHSAGQLNTSNNTIIIGQDSRPNDTNVDNELVIQNIIYGVGNSGTSSTISQGQIGIGQKNPSYQLHITGNTNNKQVFLAETDDGADIIEASESAGSRVLKFFGNTFIQPIQVAASDETTALTTGTKITFRTAGAYTLTGIKASLTTAQPSGSIFTVDVKESGVSVLSTLITIDNTETTSVTAVTPPVISDSSLASDAEMTVSITQIGTSGAAGLKVTLIGHY